MKNKGYTLIELLGVIVILASVFLLVFPSIINFIKSSSKDNDNLIATSILNAAELYVDNYATYSQVDGINFCVALSDLASLKYIPNELKLSNSNENIVDTKSVKIRYYKGYSYEIINNDKCGQNELIPVRYNGKNWIVADVSEKWYDYNNQEWANAIVLNDGISKNIGDVVSVEGDNPDVKAMFVWIPRYEYKIDGEYGFHNSGMEGTIDLPGEIKINLISENKKESSDGYMIHPAFTFGDEQLSGLWVGKFELSHATLTSDVVNNLECSHSSCKTAKGLRIIPNVESLRNNDVSNFFYAIRFMEKAYGFNEDSVDTHMMKNVEWGAVAYLSQSKYGKYGNSLYEGKDKEIYQNKSNLYLTGSSNGTPSTETYRDSSNGQTATQGIFQCEYDLVENNCGIGASTTGNITGIYDMSGGASEYVMGALDDNKGKIIVGATLSENAGFSGVLGSGDLKENGTILPNSKYFDAYASYGLNDLGHAISETSNLNSQVNSWYNDYSIFVSTTTPWFTRGGSFDRTNGGGIFYFNNWYGSAKGNDTARVVLIYNN